MRSLCGCLLLVAMIVAALFIASASHEVLAASPDFTVSPSLINRHQTVGINVTVNQLPGLITYQFNISVALPNSTLVFKLVSLQSNINGQGIVSVRFPSDFSSGSTILDGGYQVQVAETQPLANSLGVQSFTVSNQIALNVLSPLSASNFTRGNSTSILAEAKDVQGKPLSSLNVNFTTPTNASVAMTNLLGTGVYSYQYTIAYSDPMSWRLQVTATDPWGNYGSQTVNVFIRPASLYLDPLRVTDYSGNVLSSIAVNRTIYVYFQATYPDGSFVTSGYAMVTILAPGGVPMARLNATYDSSRSGFFTSTGYFVAANQPTGKWSAILYTAQLDDGNGNTGPSVPTLVGLDIHSPPFAFDLTTATTMIPLFLLGLGALGSAVILTRRGRAGFDYFAKITEGGIPDRSLVMLYGDSKTGKSLLLEELLYQRLKEGKPCIYITYELTTDEIMKNASDFGWDLEPFVESGRLTIIDNSDLMSSLDLSRTRMKLSSVLTLKENAGLQLFIDSMDLLFEDLDYREVKIFLSRLTDEVRKLSGSVYFSLTTSSVIKQTIPQIQDILDWSIELQARRSGNRVERVMMVKKLKDVHFKGSASRFKLVKRKGMVFDIPLIRRLRMN